LEGRSSDGTGGAALSRSVPAIQAALSRASDALATGLPFARGQRWRPEGRAQWRLLDWTVLCRGEGGAASP